MSPLGADIIENESEIFNSLAGENTKKKKKKPRTTTEGEDFCVLLPFILGRESFEVDDVDGSLIRLGDSFSIPLASSSSLLVFMQRFMQ